jgi:hypothetical protein
MRRVRSLLRRVRSLLAREARNVELSEELAFHLEQAIADNMARGIVLAVSRRPQRAVTRRVAPPGSKILGMTFVMPYVRSENTGRSRHLRC